MSRTLRASCSAKEGTLTTTGVSGLAANRQVSRSVFVKGACSASRAIKGILHEDSISTI